MHRLSLLVPARNAARTLPRLFESAAQDGGFDEVIVYDDASTDDTGAVARAHGANVIRSEINTGPSAGKNRLARETACGWVHFHDADDALAPGFVARLRHWMHQPAIDVVVLSPTGSLRFVPDRDVVRANLVESTRASRRYGRPTGGGESF